MEAFLDVIRPRATDAQFETLRQSLLTGEEFEATLDFADLYETFDNPEYALPGLPTWMTGLEFAFYADKGLAASILDESGDLYRGKVNFDLYDANPLVYAVSLGRMDRVNQLLELGADPDLDGYRNTPLRLAASLGDIDIVRRLLEAGASTKSEKVLVSACGASHTHTPRIIELLIFYGATLCPLFFAYASRRGLETLREMGLDLASHTDREGRDLFEFCQQELRRCIASSNTLNCRSWYDNLVERLRFCQENGMARDGFDVESLPPYPEDRAQLVAVRAFYA